MVQVFVLSNKHTEKVGNLKQNKVGVLPWDNFLWMSVVLTTGEAPVVMAVLRDETVEEWERVALLQARSTNFSRNSQHKISHS